ncbi:unnamed protein product [Knipowitschia caucasica]|uniref:FYVE, RhoGEF and PH domain-containing protein 4 n=1 Tax=Knipowitschia caucasica TaxID=637954 RepID=A0AAV2IUJ3_KNICA
MFELKKRRSLPLTCSKDAEEFRRVAVRRKLKAHTDCDLRFSYSCKDPFKFCGASQSSLEPEEGQDRSPAKRSLHKPQVPPKPLHLQTPERSELQNRPKDKSPNCFIHPSLNLYLPSPVKPICKNASPPHSGAARTSQTTYCAPSPTMASQSSADVGAPNSSPRRERKCSPKRSPVSSLMRTPSPVFGKMWTYTPSRISKPLLGINRLFDGEVRSSPKSLSVPDLISYLEESSIYLEKDRSPLQPLETNNISGSDIINKTNNFQSDSIVKVNKQTVVKENDNVEESKRSVGISPKFYCKWSEDVITEVEHKEEPKVKESVTEANDPEQKLGQIANEFLQTERAYVERLHLLDQVFCSRLTEEANQGSFPPEVVKNIFSNISSIFSFHSQFLLPDLEKCLSNKDDCPGLGSVLLQHAPFMRMYADYVRNFGQSLELVRTWTERSAAFRSVIQELQSLQECGSLTLQHHMLEPVQRLPRYELLLTDYLKKLPEDHPDYQPAQKSLETISMATLHSNSAIEKAEALRKLLEVYEMVGEEEVVNPTNEFLKEGRLVKLAARNTAAMERRLFLFNNFLLCCSPKFSLVGQKYAVRCRIGVDGMNVQPTVNEGHPFTFQVSGKEKTVELQASSAEERDEWIKVIQEAIGVFHKKNESFKTAARESVLVEPMKELGRRAPKWIRDNEVTLCMKCNEAFNPLTRRRHHCRACGNVVCWKCSDNKIALEYDSNKLNKVCKSCFFILTAQRQRSDSDIHIWPSLMSGFLNYGDNPQTKQLTWTVLSKKDPLVLYLYASPQDTKPQSTIPLPGYTVDTGPQDFQGQVCFSLRQSKISHTFFCDHTELRDRWMTALKAATAPSSDPGNDASSSSSEDYVIIDDTQ